MRSTPAVVSSLLVGLLTISCATSKPPLASRNPKVVFVCEHGNVKSLMAASYFNQLSAERGLPHRAVSRGSAPDSTTVPPKIVEGLRGDGFDVSAFRPVALSESDFVAAERVVAISTSLPAGATPAPGARVEEWQDVPPASLDYRAARESLQAHVRKLVEELAALER